MPVTDEHTWGDAVEHWCNARDRNPAELLSLAKFGRGFPDRALSQVTREAVHEALSFVVAASTYKRYRAMILSILNLARKEGWLKEAPDLAQRHVKKKSKPWLTPEQWETLYAELAPHQKPMAALAIETGLRQANVLQLRWSQVSIKRRIISIAAEKMKGNVAHAVPLNDAALEILKGQVGQHKEFVFVFEGKPIGDVKTAFIKACVRAKLGTVTVEDGHTHYEGFTWHGFRHTWATWHAQNGTPMHTLQALGGWADLKMVMNYAQHSPQTTAAYAGNNRRST